MYTTEWIQNKPETKHLPLGYFGSSTGAAAALIAASNQINNINAVVSRGGRTDLADAYLPKIASSTLFIVGSKDEIILEINKRSYELLHCDKKLLIIKGATHLFEEKGKLEEAAEASANWFFDKL